MKKIILSAAAAVAGLAVIIAAVVHIKTNGGNSDV